MIDILFFVHFFSILYNVILIGASDNVTKETLNDSTGIKNNTSDNISDKFYYNITIANDHSNFVYVNGSYGYLCSGVLFTPIHVLTVASCFYGNQDSNASFSITQIIVIHVNSTFLAYTLNTNHNIRKIHVHPKFEYHKRHNFNVAVVELNSSLQLSASNYVTSNVQFHSIFSPFLHRSVVSGSFLLVHQRAYYCNDNEGQICSEQFGKVIAQNIELKACSRFDLDSDYGPVYENETLLCGKFLKPHNQHFAVTTGGVIIENGTVVAILISHWHTNTLIFLDLSLVYDFIGNIENISLAKEKLTVKDYETKNNSTTESMNHTVLDTTPSTVLLNPSTNASVPKISIPKVSTSNITNTNETNHEITSVPEDFKKYRVTYYLKVVCIGLVTIVISGLLVVLIIRRRNGNVAPSYSLFYNAHDR